MTGSGEKRRGESGEPGGAPLTASCPATAGFRVEVRLSVKEHTHFSLGLSYKPSRKGVDNILQVFKLHRLANQTPSLRSFETGLAC